MLKKLVADAPVMLSVTGIACCCDVGYKLLFNFVGDYYKIPGWNSLAVTGMQFDVQIEVWRALGFLCWTLSIEKHANVTT